MTIKDIIVEIEKFAPLDLQLEWDNSGMQVGDFLAEAIGAVLTLDVTPKAIEFAKAKNANLIISHHPLIFSGLRSITGSTTVEKIVIDAIKSDIAIYSSHTSIDAARDGVSWAMAKRLALENVRTLTEDEKIGCIGNLSAEISIEEFVNLVKKAYDMPSVRINRNPLQRVGKVAVIGGSGSQLISEAIAQGADAIVTGDLKYHDFQNCEYRAALLDIGHYKSEIEVLDIFMKIITEKYPTFALYIHNEDFVSVL